MKAIYDSYYRSKKTGSSVFVYAVQGTKEEIKDYVETQGENIRFKDVNGKPTETPLFYATRAIAKTIDLIKITNRKTGEMQYIADNSELALEVSMQVTREQMSEELRGNNRNETATVKTVSNADLF